MAGTLALGQTLNATCIGYGNLISANCFGNCVSERHNEACCLRRSLSALVLNKGQHNESPAVLTRSNIFHIQSQPQSFEKFMATSRRPLVLLNSPQSIERTHLVGHV